MFGGVRRSVCGLLARPLCRVSVLSMECMSVKNVNTSLYNVHGRSFAKKVDKNDKKGGKGSDSGDSGSSAEFDTVPFITKFDAQVTYCKDQFSNIRVGRPTPEILEEVMIDIGGSKTALKNIAQVYVKPPQSLIVSLYEPSDAVESATCKAIIESNSDLNPVMEVVNGVNAIVVPFPKPTKEVREALVKQAKVKSEDVKTHVRGVRKLWMDALKKANPPKDDLKRMEKDCQTHTDKRIDEITSLLQAKEKEIQNA